MRWQVWLSLTFAINLYVYFIMIRILCSLNLLLLIQFANAETEIDCSAYDPAKVHEYTSSWMGNDQYYLFENYYYFCLLLLHN